MGEITTIGLDLAKHVFQVHGVDAEVTAVLRKQLRRGQVLAFFSKWPPCVVGLEACTTAHYWARELRWLGHKVRLMPAQYVKAYICREASKNENPPWIVVCPDYYLTDYHLTEKPSCEAGHITASDLCAAR